MKATDFLLTFAKLSHNGVLVFLHVKQLENFIHVCDLLLPGNVSGLTEKGAEFESFANSARTTKGTQSVIRTENAGSKTLTRGGHPVVE